VENDPYEWIRFWECCSPGASWVRHLVFRETETDHPVQSDSRLAFIQIPFL